MKPSWLNPNRCPLCGWLPLGVLLPLALVCSARLVADPTALLVDGERASVDHQPTPQATPTPGNDLTRLFLPHHARIAQLVARLGRVPAWDPAGFGGRPRVGNPQAGLFYPPVWLAWIGETHVVLTWLTVAHLVWGGLGVYRLMRSSGLGSWPATVAGACYQACPYLLAQAFEGHLPHVWAASWYPWAFWAFLGLRRGERWGLFALPPILSLSLLSGHPQEGYYLVFCLSTWAAYEVAQRAWRSGIRGQSQSTIRCQPGGLRFLLSWLSILGLTLGLTAVEWLPDLLASRWTLSHPGLAPTKARLYHLHPLNLLQLLSPRALGRPTDYIGGDNYWETVLSIGGAPLVLGLLALRRSPRRAFVRGWAILVALTVLFAAGRELVVFKVLATIVPGMGHFRVPARSLMLASLAASILAGVGTETVVKPIDGPLEDRRAWSSVYSRLVFPIVAALLVARCVTAATPDLGRADQLRRWLEAAARLATDPLFWPISLGTWAALLWLARRPRDSAYISRALGVLAIAELGLHGAWLWKATPASRFLGPDPINAAIARIGPRKPHRIRARDQCFEDLRTLPHGLEKTNLNDSFQIAHAADLYEWLYPLFEPKRPRQPETPQKRAIRQAVLDRMNVALLISDRPEPGMRWPVVADIDWRRTHFAIYRNDSALPRAYVVPEAYVRPDGPEVAELLPLVPPREAVILSSDPLPVGVSRQAFTPASYDSADPDRVDIRVTTLAAGLLVIADTWVPGWTAWLDGSEVPILRGNHCQRVIAIPGAGRHHIAMRFHPPGLAGGVALTATSALLWLIAAAYAARRDADRGARNALDSPVSFEGEASDSSPNLVAA